MVVIVLDKIDNDDDTIFFIERCIGRTMFQRAYVINVFSFERKSDWAKIVFLVVKIITCGVNLKWGWTLISVAP
jgi:hypothetical protein